MSSTDPQKRQSTSSTARPPSKRMSMLPAPPKAPTTIDPSSTIANHALLTGHYPITISAHAILHPYAKIVSSEGPVEIGEGVLVWEKGVVGASRNGEGGVGGMQEEGDDEEEEESELRVTRLGRNVVIETGAVVEAGSIIGEGSVLEGFVRVGEGSKIGKYCKITTQIRLPPHSTLSDYTILYGQHGQRRKDKTMQQNHLIQDIKATTHQKQIKGLQQLIPSNLAKWSTA